MANLSSSAASHCLSRVPFVNHVVDHVVNQHVRTELYNRMERVMGIEPTLSAWEAEVLPLNYTRELYPRTISTNYTRLAY